MSRTLRRAAYPLLTAALLCGLALTPPAQSRPQTPDPPPETNSAAAAEPAAGQVTNALVRDLRRKRYQVTRGYPKLYTLEDCEQYSFPIMKNCFGNNPAAPYIFPIVKSWPDEYVDPATVNAFGKTRAGYSATYRLGHREAIVVLGKMPPPGRYMGLQSYVFSGEARMHRLSGPYLAVRAKLPEMLKFLFAWVPGQEHRRLQTFSSVSNPINNVVVEQGSGASWGKTRYFVITADRGMNRVVRRALARQGVPDRFVFTEPIPAGDADDGDARKSVEPPIHRLGLGKRANDFLTAMRYALPDDERAGNAWRQSLPLTVLRVRATGPARSVKPYPPLVYEPRVTPVNEVTGPQLRRGLVRLAAKVCERWGQPCDPKPLINLQGFPIRGIGRDCREIGENCAGDNWDASYFIAGARPLDSGEVYALVGTLGTQTGNATYVALSVNNLEKLAGVINVSDPELKGSARAYSRSVRNHSKFFVHYLTRNCARIRDLTDGECTSVDRTVLPRGVKFASVVREYLAPGTRRGPDPTKLLKPRIIELRQP